MIWKYFLKAILKKKLFIVSMPVIKQILQNSINATSDVTGKSKFIRLNDEKQNLMIKEQSKDDGIWSKNV